MASPTLDFKTAVHQVCQRFCDRPVTDEDIIFAVYKYDGGYQATCKLECIGGQEFAGELAETRKDAEKLAAQQVLDFYADQDAADMPKAGAASNDKKRPATDVVYGPPAQIPRLENPVAAGSTGNPNSITAKSELNATVLKIMRRLLDKNEIKYETKQVSGGYMSTIRIPGLPEPWGAESWTGDSNLKKQVAEQSAAQKALYALRGDPTLMAAHNAQSAKAKERAKAKGSSKGKDKGGMGKGGMPKGGKGQWDWDPWTAAAASMFGMGPWW